MPDGRDRSLRERLADVLQGLVEDGSPGGLDPPDTHLDRLDTAAARAGQQPRSGYKGRITQPGVAPTTL
jgi:hypothetical protein